MLSARNYFRHSRNKLDLGCAASALVCVSVSILTMLRMELQPLNRSRSNNPRSLHGSLDPYTKAIDFVLGFVLGYIIILSVRRANRTLRTQFCFASRVPFTTQLGLNSTHLAQLFQLEFRTHVDLDRIKHHGREERAYTGACRPSRRLDCMDLVHMVGIANQETHISDVVKQASHLGIDLLGVPLHTGLLYQDQVEAALSLLRTDGEEVALHMAPD